jgi:hypothetical protein
LPLQRSSREPLEAQAVNMLRQAGAGELPDVMLISMARQEGQHPGP